MPRLSSNHASSNEKDNKKLIAKSLGATALIAAPLTIGLCIICRDFVPLYFGAGYDGVILLLAVSSPILMIRGLSENISKQYLLATDKKKAYISTIILGFAVNIMINIALIPKYGAIGATIATIISELLIAALQIIMIKIISIKDVLKTAMLFVLYSFPILAGGILVDMVGLEGVISLITKVIMGAILYVATLLIAKEDIFYNIMHKMIKTLKKEHG